MSSLPFSFVRTSIGYLYQAAKRRLRQWTMPHSHALVLNAAMDLTRSKSELVLENAFLRQQLTVLKCQMKRPALTWRDRTLFVFVIIELGSRRLVHFGVTRNPTDAWVPQQLREATPFGDGPRYLIRDYDREYGRSFARVAAGTGIEALRTPYGAPKASAICERFIGSVRREFLDHFLILSERHLHRVMKEYKTYLNHARLHQGIGQSIPCQPVRGTEPPKSGELVCRPVLGDVHHDYQWPVDERPSYPRAA
jgi:transposase InsO family protein